MFHDVADIAYHESEQGRIKMDSEDSPVTSITRPADAVFEGITNTVSAQYFLSEEDEEFGKHLFIVPTHDDASDLRENLPIDVEEQPEEVEDSSAQSMLVRVRVRGQG